MQPVKVDPKAIKRRPVGVAMRLCSTRQKCTQVFFANERTFLAWVHMALMLGGMAVGIIGFSTKSGLSPLPGLVLLPVAICFVVHALGQYYARARAIRRREPGPYEDKNGPVALAIVLFIGGVLEHPDPFGGVVALTRDASTARRDPATHARAPSPRPTQ